MSDKRLQDCGKSNHDHEDCGKYDLDDPPAPDRSGRYGDDARSIKGVSSAFDE